MASQPTKPRQFRISHLLFATFLYAAAFVVSPRITLIENEWGLWVIVGTVGMVARYVGWFCSSSLDCMSRHHVAWSAGIVGCAVAVFGILSFQRGFYQFVQDLRVELAAVLIYGMIVATILECGFVLCSVLHGSVGRSTESE